MDATRFAGKVALVTGAGSGIGRATALRLASEGAKVAAAELSEEGGLETLRLIAETGAKAKPRISIVAAHLAIRSRVTGYRKPMTTTAPSFLASRSASANCPSIAGLDA